MELDSGTFGTRIDVKEEDISKLDPGLLKILLRDKSTLKNILWCTKDYEYYGSAFNEQTQIKVECITGRYSEVIQPRAVKSKLVQDNRIKRRGEVFTPSWICNEQNNQVDEAWFGRQNVFNKPNGTSWETVKEKISFPNSRKDWKSYVNSKRLEITCGEAPYLVSRYDTTTGDLIPLKERIGFLDRKMRIIDENCKTEEDWDYWSIRALKSVYGYEFQGDSLLIARENILLSFFEYFRDRKGAEPSLKLLESVANIIAWNIWQMDGLKCVVPFSCHETKEEYHQLSFFDLEFSNSEGKIIQCPGCVKGDLFSHNGVYCKIYDWTGLNKSIRFIDVIREIGSYGTI